MKLKKYAPFGLYLSLVALLVSASIYFVQRSLTFALEISLGVCLVGLIFYVLFDPKRALRTVIGNQERRRNDTIISTLAIIGILTIMNYLANKTLLRLDLTQNKNNTLSNQSVQVIQSLTDSVLAKAFYSQNIPDEKARALLENYKFHSRGKFDYQFIDPVTNPIAAKEMGITHDGTIVLSMGKRIEHVTSPSEQELTSALIRLINPGERTIYFLTGHGESIPQEQEGLYSQLRQNLLSKNYALNTLNLLDQPDIPSTATEVIILNPLKPLTGNEVSALSAYLDSGGALILLSEPPAVTNSDPITNQLWQYLRTDWGIGCENNILVDPNAAPPLMVISQPFEHYKHPITAEISNMVAVFPTAHSLAVDTSLQKVDTTELAKTSASTWGETDLIGLRNQQMKPDSETDQNGPLTIAIAAQNHLTGARLVVIGDADFANDQYFQAFGNRDLITNAIDWAAKQDNLINLDTKPDIVRVLIPPTQSAFLLIVLIVTVLLPVSIIVIGIIVSLRRRRSS